MKAVSYQNNAREAWRPGVETRMLVSASNGAAQLCIFEQWVAPGVGAPTHSHPVEEVLTVREGEAEMWIDEERVIVTAGRTPIWPARGQHAFFNSGPAPPPPPPSLAFSIFVTTPPRGQRAVGP